jgi:hypothetical protein
MLRAVDEGDVAALVLLDRSAAFDTVDHDILLRRIHSSLGFDGTVFDWFRYHLTSQTQRVRCGRSLSTMQFLHDLRCSTGITSAWSATVHHVRGRPNSPRCTPQPRCTSVRRRHPSLRAAETASLADSIAMSLDDVACWMRSNRL